MRRWPSMPFDDVEMIQRTPMDRGGPDDLVPPESASQAPGPDIDRAGLDVIGDVHGYASRLVRLLEQLGYRDEHGSWRHPTRRAVFVGDLIDRGPQQLQTLRIVRPMVDAGAAEVVMGNHEFNAIAYATVNPATLDYCRTHDEKHEGQHRAFLAEVGFDTPLHREIVAWFRRIPLWLERNGLRVVHACWSERHLDVLRRELGGSLLDDQAIIEGTRRGSPLYDAIEVVLKGPEIGLGGAWYPDKEGNRRWKARLRWWDPQATSLPAAMMIPADTTFYDATDVALPRPPTGDVPPSDLIDRDASRPVLFGHYWWRRNSAEPVRRNATCIDYSVAAGGVLAAYRWNSGDTHLNADRLVEV